MQRFGAKGAGTSVYFRDPDGSLMEFISYQRFGRRSGSTRSAGRARSDLSAARYSGAEGRRRRAASDRHEAAGSGAAGDPRRRLQPVDARRPHRSLHLSPHRRAGRRAAAGLGRHSGRARLHAAIVRFPRSFCRTQSARRRPCLRPFDPGHRLSARGRRAAASAVSDPVRCGSRYSPRAASADVHGGGHDAAEAHGAGHR